MFKQISLRVKFAVLFVAVALVLLVGNFFWRSYILQTQAEHEMLQTTQVLAEEMDAIWDFMEINQGQFIRHKDGTYNLYCVVAAKAVSRIFTTNNTDDFIIHYTNLTTRKPDDAPDDFETQALNALHADPRLNAYYSLEVDADGARVFRFVEPLYITDSCLECHGDPKGEVDVMGYPKEGLKEGDIAGAVSIIMPADTYLSNINSSLLQENLLFVVLILAGLAVIFFSIAKLVTEQRRELESINIRLVEDNRYKSDFLTIMSHEIRTPLTSILAFADIWARTNKPRNAEEESIMKEMRVNSQILLAMINNILEMARVEAGRSELTLEPVEIPDLLAAVRDSMGFLAEKKRVRIGVDIARSMPVVFIDAEKVRRILENLISNAIKFVGEQGAVEVITWYIYETKQLVLVVRDNGCGIKEEDRPFIFDRFVQGQGHSSIHHSGGSGLGLAVVKELAELHGGSVELDEAEPSVLGGAGPGGIATPAAALGGIASGGAEGRDLEVGGARPDGVGSGGAEGRGCTFTVRIAAACSEEGE
jgi:signal transduction histidine kinase